MLASDQKLPVSGGAEKRAYVRGMFAAIAPTYDRLNRILSLRLDLRWRKQAVAQLGWERAPDGIYLDLCAGTLDFAAILARQPGFRGRIVGADFVPRMLALGRSKAGSTHGALPAGRWWPLTGCRGATPRIGRCGSRAHARSSIASPGSRFARRPPAGGRRCRACQPCARPELISTSR